MCVYTVNTIMITVEEAIDSLYSRIKDSVYAQQSSYTCIRTFTPDPILHGQTRVFVPDPPIPKTIDKFD